MQTNKTRSATPLDECRVYVGTYGKYNGKGLGEVAEPKC